MIYDENKTKSNAELIAETYYEYHGCYEDGYTSYSGIYLSGVTVA